MAGSAKRGEVEEKDRVSRRTNKEPQEQSAASRRRAPDGDGSGSKQRLRRPGGVGVAVKGGDAGGEPARRDDLIRDLMRPKRCWTLRDEQRAGAIEREREEQNLAIERKGERNSSGLSSVKMVAESRFWGIWTAGKAVGTLGRDGCTSAYVKPAQVPRRAQKGVRGTCSRWDGARGRPAGFRGAVGAGAAAGAGLMLSGMSPLKERWRWVAEAAGRCRYAALIIDLVSIRNAFA